MSVIALYMIFEAFKNLPRQPYHSLTEAAERRSVSKERSASPVKDVATNGKASHSKSRSRSKSPAASD